MSYIIGYLQYKYYIIKLHITALYKHMTIKAHDKYKITPDQPMVYDPP